MTPNELESIKRKFDHMNIDQLCAVLGLTAPIDRRTYIYLASDGQLYAIQKPDTSSVPADEFVSYGYVRSYER